MLKFKYLSSGAYKHCKAFHGAYKLLLSLTLPVRGHTQKAKLEGVYLKSRSLRMINQGWMIK